MKTRRWLVSNVNIKMLSYGRLGRGQCGPFFVVSSPWWYDIVVIDKEEINWLKKGWNFWKKKASQIGIPTSNMLTLAPNKHLLLLSIFKTPIQNLHKVFLDIELPKNLYRKASVSRRFESFLIREFLKLSDNFLYRWGSF